ncbi:MAG: YbaK/EbsC family protein [Lachnospiraceae bacterium]|nr:YbaK/EbsC family protein [Lachnospiraceae bacterium]
MSFEKAKAYLTDKGYGDRVIETEESSATVQEAADALGVEPARIAKTLSFVTPAGPILILAEGTARVDNRKYKDTFFTKAKMIPFEEVEPLTGHAPGGVCPFGINDGVLVYLDESLRKFDVVYPAAGNGQSAVRLTVDELYEVSNAEGWVNVCKEN